MAKKLYISLPMSGCETTVKARYEKALERIKKHNTLKEYEIVPPFDIDNFGDKGLKEIDPSLDVAYFMGRDIEILLRCDAIYLCNGWKESKGCLVEGFTAHTYKLEIYYEV